MDCNPANIFIGDFTLTSVQSRTDFDAERSNLVGNRASAADPARWSVKCGQNAIARCLYLMSAKAREVASDRGMMSVKQITPAAVAERRGLLGRPDNVGEEDCGKHAIYWDSCRRAGQKLFDHVGDLVRVVTDPWRDNPNYVQR